MQYWYPTQSRVQGLGSEIASLEELTKARGEDSRDISGVSDTLIRAFGMPGFPKRQIRQWVWLASQFRLHRRQDQIGAIAGAALCFLERRLSPGLLAESDVQDLNWVLETALRRLIDHVGPDALRSCLGVDDLCRIQKRLAGYDCESQFDALILRTRIERHMANLRALSSDANLATLSDKIEALFVAAAESGSKASVARSALLYLADIPDLVPDSNGFLGLVDDIYVIEWAYAVVEDQTRCLPLLDALIRNWPYVADLAIREDEPSTLNRYAGASHNGGLPSA